jgi:cell wall-associated NlpC family hydrolase
MINQLKWIAEKIAFSFLGKPYIWGGDDPVDGFDCSGFCIEILKSVGLLPRKGDWTAQGLWHKFDKCILDERTEPYKGCLVFWTNVKGDKIIHVEYLVDKYLSIGASGGGSKTQNKNDAINQNAYIKVRPYGTRPRIKGFVDPYLSIKN